MSTSLAEQLRRLATPQTSLLVDSKKRASILFDVKEAANKDRETIFDIGISGLQELIALNPSFSQFEQTLFDRTSRDLERSVETTEVNKNLDKSIKKFLFHLSPYFLLQPAHKCLEWLIRRFAINEYNKNEFMILILPYHETRMFVKCVQIMPLMNPKDPWHWLHSIQRPGTPLSKQILLSRAASNGFLLKFICKSTHEAVKELDVKAYTLRALFAFYCTTVLGALDVAAQVTDLHISNIFSTVAKGLRSNISDFCAASLMITGQLVVKTKLSLKFLNQIILLLSKIVHPGLQNDAVMLLVLIYQKQNETLKSVNEEALITIVANKWIPSTFGRIYADGINIIPFYLPLITTCLKNVQLKTESWKSCKTFCENMLMEVMFTSGEAEQVIRSILGAYILRDKNEMNVITIESDDDNVMLTNDNEDITVWYSNLLKSLERQYPEVIDRVTKEIMKDQDQPSRKKKSLKTVLGFLFTAACTDNGANIFENLYHHNATHRIEATKYLIQNFNQMCFSDDSKDLLKDSIGERLSDDSTLVVQEVLKFSTADLKRIVGHQNLVDKLCKLLEKSLTESSWGRSLPSIAEHITSPLILNEENVNQIFLSIFPYFFHSCHQNENFINLILNSDLANYIPLLKSLRSTNLNVESTLLQFDKNLEKQQLLTDLESLIETIQKIPTHELNTTKAFFNLTLLVYSLPQKNLSPKLAHDILAISGQYSRMFKKKQSVASELKRKIAGYAITSMGEYPIQITLLCLTRIIKSGSLKNVSPIDFDKQTESLQLILQIYETIVDGLWTTEDRQNDLFNDALLEFFNAVLPLFDQRIEFFTNFFIVHRIAATEETSQIRIDSQRQVQSIRIFNSMLKHQRKESAEITIVLPALIRILSAISAPAAAVRVCAFETISLLSKFNLTNPKYALLIGRLLPRMEELILDSNQLALILYKIFCDKPTASEKQLLSELFEYVGDADEPTILRAALIDILMHVNSGDILKKISSSALSIIERNSVDLKNNKTVILNANDSFILKSVLFRFNNDTITAIKTAQSCWDVLLQSLENHNLLLSIDNQLRSVTIVLIELLELISFDELLEKHKKSIVTAIIRSAAVTENTDVLSAATKLMKSIEIDGKNHLDQFAEMTAAGPSDDTVATTTTPRKQNRTAVATLSSNILNAIEWKCGVALLEYLQNKKRLKNAHTLIPSLFSVLNRCLEFEDQSLVEYTKQLILSCILHCCQLISPDGQAKRELLPDKVFKINLVVQCIRGTQNPQTHHHALQLLSHTASMIPELVLHNMMDIFTFMGSTVVRRDDAYTYQIISNIIKSIIPTLIKANQKSSGEKSNELVIPVLRVFSDIILDVPEHRRLRLYEDLLRTLDPKEFLWMFLAVLFESHVRNFKSTGGQQQTVVAKQIASTKPELKRIEIAVEITNKFDCDIILETCSKLVEFLHKQTNVNKQSSSADGTVAMDIDITDTSIFNVQNYSNYQLRHFKYTTLQFIIQLTDLSSGFVTKIAALDQTDTITLKPHFKHIIVTVLKFIGKVIKTTSQSTGNFWNIILGNCYDILDQVLALIYPDMLLQVVGGLLNKNNIPEVRKKAIELLNKKLQLTDFFENCDKSTILSLLDPLYSIVESINDEDKLVKFATTTENSALQQHALIAIKLLSILLAKDNPESFTPVLDILSKILKRNNEISLTILAQLILCLAEVCSNLRAHAIAHLSKFMPALAKILNKQIKCVEVSPNIILHILTGIYKIIETLPLFLSPYLVNIIVSLSQIWSRLSASAGQQDTQKKILKLDAIWKKLASVLSLRILIPMIDQCYKKLIDLQEYSAIGPLVTLLKDSFANLNGSDIVPYQSELGTLFLMVLQFRADHELPNELVDVQEDFVIQAFVALILKLSESSFRPLYYKVFDWAIRDNSSIERAITFYRLSSLIAESLKSLFVLFASDFIQNASDLLEKCQQHVADDENETIAESTIPSTPIDCTTLIDSIIKTLSLVFLHDSQNFVNTHRFEILLQPIVNQLENKLVLENAGIKAEVSQCLAKLAGAINDDTMWKQLNYQILLKTRNTNSDIKLFALSTCVEVAKKLGDNYLPLLPETIPFLAELLEDENQHIERNCQQSVQELERVLGEPLQKYF